MAATSGGPKGGWPPRQRSWRPATPAQAASRPVWLSAARSPAPRHRWTVWRGWPHRPPRRCRAIRSGSRPWRPTPARASPGLHPATGAGPHHACAGATCAHPGPNQPCPKLLSLSSSSPSCGSRPLTGCLSEPGSAALRIILADAPTVTAVVITGGMHAREWVPPDALVNLAADLLEAHSRGTGLRYGGQRFLADDIRSV